jgi:hypothetical protein
VSCCPPHSHHPPNPLFSLPLPFPRLPPSLLLTPNTLSPSLSLFSPPSPPPCTPPLYLTTSYNLAFACDNSITSHSSSHVRHDPNTRSTDLKTGRTVRVTPDPRGMTSSLRADTGETYTKLLLVSVSVCIL